MRNSKRLSTRQKGFLTFLISADVIAAGAVFSNGFIPDESKMERIVQPYKPSIPSPIEAMDTILYDSNNDGIVDGVGSQKGAYWYNDDYTGVKLPGAMEMTSYVQELANLQLRAMHEKSLNKHARH